MIRFRPLRRCALAPAALLMAALVAPGCGASEAKVVAECVAGIPPGLKVLQARGHSGRSIYYYAHCRLGPGDLAQILAAEPYKRRPDGQPLPDYRSLKLDPWWDPASLSPGLVAYSYEQSDPNDKDDFLWAKTLYTNALGDEAFLFKVYGY